MKGINNEITSNRILQYTTYFSNRTEITTKKQGRAYIIPAHAESITRNRRQRGNDAVGSLEVGINGI